MNWSCMVVAILQYMKIHMWKASRLTLYKMRLLVTAHHSWCILRHSMVLFILLHYIRSPQLVADGNKSTHSCLPRSKFISQGRNYMAAWRNGCLTCWLHDNFTKGQITIWHDHKSINIFLDCDISILSVLKLQLMWICFVDEAKVTTIIAVLKVDCILSVGGKKLTTL